mmetsp:Transcript_26318/g.23103  ORF Transcript_26318/g.23103 Transcript_26318/m.23103 type:complete len:342 (+) Transcript_26318:97-1122(+)
MLKSIFVSSLVISQILAADFDYPEDGESWADASVLGVGKTNYCGSTHRFQSPIDIHTSTLSTCPTTKPLTWKLEPIHKFIVENTGHNLKMIPQCCGIIDNEDSGSGDGDDSNDDSHDDSDDNPEFENLKSGKSFGVLTDIFGSMEEYCLDSFHIHWGKDDNEGSEHRINGEQSVMEMHFVHRACTYDTISKAIGIEINDDSTADRTLAVVSVLFETGEENELIKKIVEEIAKLKEPEHEIVIESNMFDVVPMNEGKIDGEYYHYKGSLTTPPCTPVVSWHVLEKKMTVSQAQLDSLRKYIQKEDGTVGHENFRGAKTNGHKVYKCSASGSGDDDSDDEKDD